MDAIMTNPMTIDRPRSGWMPKVGWALSALVILFLLMDGGMKLVPLQVVIDTTKQLGWPMDASLWRLLGAILLVATVLYAYPRTAFLGAILITAWLGGAIATHVRIGSPLFTHTFFSIYLGLMMWGGLWLRDARLRALLR